jgi:hypothetical protein
MIRKAPTSPIKLKVKIPFAFEAEGQGLAPIFCLAGLCALFLVLSFLSFAERGSQSYAVTSICPM